MIETMYESYNTELVRWCTGMCGDPDTAQEMVQEGWLKALAHEDDLRALDEAARRAWMYRTVKHLYIDRYRRSKREVLTDDAYPADRTVPHHHPANDIEWMMLLNELPGLEGVLFTMRYLQGYNAKQLGEMFDMPPGTVRSKLHDAKKHLRDLLK